MILFYVSETEKIRPLLEWLRYSPLPENRWQRVSFNVLKSGDNYWIDDQTMTEINEAQDAAKA